MGAHREAWEGFMYCTLELRARSMGVGIFFLLVLSSKLQRRNEVFIEHYSFGLRVVELDVEDRCQIAQVERARVKK